MKLKDKKDLLTKSLAELKKSLKDAYDQLRSIKLEKEQNLLKNTSLLTLKRKEIAVIQTLIKQKKGGK
jgi:ribosomal protein L29